MVVLDISQNRAILVDIENMYASGQNNRKYSVVKHVRHLSHAKTICLIISEIFVKRH